MISDDIQAALNGQLNLEFYSSYRYLAMSHYFHSMNLTGFASWMQMQADEERTHAMKVYDFLNDREATIDFMDIKSPNPSWESPLAVFEDAFESERNVTENIYNLVDLSLQQRDHATNTFLQWFVTEQVEEEALITEIVEKMKLIGSDGNGLFIMDRDMAERPKEDDGDE